jgi:hypothetical protein
MRYRAALAAMALLLVACDQRAPTEPGPIPEPAFQVGQDQVRVSLSRNAEWNSEFQITVNGSFTCPEGNTGQLFVQVVQFKSNGTTQQGSSFGNEACRFGSNKWSVTVFGFGSGWDQGPAVASVILSSFGPAGFGVDSDNGEINIR